MNSPDSRKLLAIIDAFVQIDLLQNSQGYDEIISRTVKESGLNSISISTLGKLRSELSQYRQWVQKNAR